MAVRQVWPAPDISLSADPRLEHRAVPAFIPPGRAHHRRGEDRHRRPGAVPAPRPDGGGGGLARPGHLLRHCCGGTRMSLHPRVRPRPVHADGAFHAGTFRHTPHRAPGRPAGHRGPLRRRPWARLPLAETAGPGPRSAGRRPGAGRPGRADTPPPLPAGHRHGAAHGQGRGGDPAGGEARLAGTRLPVARLDRGLQHARSECGVRPRQGSHRPADRERLGSPAARGTGTTPRNDAPRTGCPSSLSASAWPSSSSGRALLTPHCA